MVVSKEAKTVQRACGSTSLSVSTHQIVAQDIKNCALHKLLMQDLNRLAPQLINNGDIFLMNFLYTFCKILECLNSIRDADAMVHNSLIIIHEILLHYPCVLTWLKVDLFTASESFIGVNYGTIADNLPPAASTASLLASTSIGKLRLYEPQPDLVSALAAAGSGISLLLGVPNSDVPTLAASPAAAAAWAAANIPATVPVSAISVGNELLSSGDPTLATQLLPAMQNLLAALPSGASAAPKISTVHSMAVLASSDPPSSGAFHADLAATLDPVLEFLNQNGAPFMINPYPYFAYQSDPRPDTLAFCLFQPNAGRVDGGSKIKYTNMFDAQVDAVKSALGRAGYGAVEIVVAETGWPTKGDPTEAGASVDNARAYVANLVAHLRSGAGTPLMPGKAVDTYLFALYDEDLKPGPASERSFGLYHTDLSMAYDAGLAASAASGSNGNGQGAAVQPTKGGWCVASVAATDAQLQTDMDYACAQVGVDCGAIQPGGACFEPNTVRAHAAYAMNQLYHAAGAHPWNCDFRQSATLTSSNPSYGSCVFTGGQ